MHRSRWEGVRCPGAPREIEALNLHGKINKIRPPPPLPPSAKNGYVLP